MRCLASQVVPAVLGQRKAPVYTHLRALVCGSADGASPSRHRHITIATHQAFGTAAWKEAERGRDAYKDKQMEAHARVRSKRRCLRSNRVERKPAAIAREVCHSFANLSAGHSLEDTGEAWHGLLLYVAIPPNTARAPAPIARCIWLQDLALKTSEACRGLPIVHCRVCSTMMRELAASATLQGCCSPLRPHLSLQRVSIHHLPIASEMRSYTSPGSEPRDGKAPR